MIQSRVVAIAAMLLALTGVSSTVRAQSECGNPFTNHYGPFDYRTATKENLALVERVHFTPGVETMTKPATTTYATMASDVGYTLHVFPNHHRALITMAKLGERHKTDQPPGASFTVDCYHQRAVIYRPDDNVARLLYVQFLAKQGKEDAVLAHLREAQRRAGDNLVSIYNIGLVAYDVGAFDIALNQAHLAAAAGYSRKGLEERLRKSGRWIDPPTQPASGASDSLR
ncbi:MAG: hypothetical protein ACOVPA_19500 [Rubrivivax sp.]